VSEDAGIDNTSSCEIGTGCIFIEKKSIGLQDFSERDNNKQLVKAVFKHENIGVDPFKIHR
jgi:hypothetical protein